MWHANIIGYIFSISIGHFFIKPLVDETWKCIGWKGPGDLEFRADSWQPEVIGIVERTLYTASLVIDRGDFIGVWLAIKVAGQWKRWGEENGRSIYQNFLIGNGFSILYSVVGFKLITWISKGNWLLAISVPLTLVLITICLRFCIRDNCKMSKKGKINEH